MNTRKGILAAAALLAALWVLIPGARGAAAEAVYPAENAHSWFSRTVVSRVKALFKTGDLVRENVRLKTEVAQLKLAAQDRDRLTRENARLSALLAFSEAPRNKGNWLCAPVLARGGTVGSATLLRVGKGSADGVTTGATVAVPEGLVGRVEAVSPHTASVRLITDPAVQVACRVDTGDPDLATISGILMGGRTRTFSPTAGATLFYLAEPLRLRHLKRNFTLPPQARIVTSGRGGVFPAGLTVGTLLGDSRPDASRLEREGDVVPAVDFAALENVFIHREN